MRSVIEIGEFQTLHLANLDLASSDLDALTSGNTHTRHFNVEFHRDGIHIRPRGYVGLLPLTSEISVNVRSWLTTESLLRILEGSGRWPRLIDRSLQALANEEVDADRMVWLLANSLRLGIDDILELGWLYEYIPTKEIGSFPRGRILWNETTELWARGLSQRVACTVAIRSADNAANQIVRSALEQILIRLHHLRISATCSRVEEAIAALESHRHLMRHISVVAPSALLSDPILAGRVPLPPSRAHYEAVIRVSREILRATQFGFRTQDEGVSLPHFAVEMRSAFESYIRNLIREVGEADPSRFKIGDGMYKPPRGARRNLFSNHSGYEVAPDVVVSRANDSRVALVAEVKYILQGTSIERRYIERLLTYALAYRTDTVVMIHPVFCASEDGLLEIGCLAGIRIYHYSFSLGARSLESAEEKFRATIAVLLGVQSQVSE